MEQIILGWMKSRKVEHTAHIENRKIAEMQILVEKSERWDGGGGK